MSADIGLFTIDTTARTARGTLLPWGVKSKGTSSSNTAPITFPRGSVTIPRDLSVISLNDEHGRWDVLGRAVEAIDTEAGIDAVFHIADTDEGDAWLQEHGERAYFSAEIKHLRRTPGDVGSGVLAGAAVTATPAFDGTAVFSLLGTEQPAEPAEDDEDDEDEDTEPAPAEPEEEPAEPDDTEEDAMADAVAPKSMLASRAPAVASPRLTKAGFFSAVHHARAEGRLDLLQPYMKSAQEVGTFALADIKFDGTGGLTTDAAWPGAWLGEIAGGARFARTIVPLLTPKPLTSPKASGWRWLLRPSMAVWAGNKAPIPSAPATVEPVDFGSIRLAGGNDLAREYVDFGVTEVLDSYNEAMVDSYFLLSDDYTLTALEAGATAATLTATSVTGQLVQLARAVFAARVQPSFIIVAPDVFDAYTDQTQGDQSAYFSPVIGLVEGNLSGIPMHVDDRLAAGHAIAGAKSAATVWELPGSPIRVDAVALANGGYDRAFFGYVGAGVEYPAGIQKATITLPAPPPLAARGK